MAFLLEEAVRIKDDIVTSLRTTQTSVQTEAFSRRLLENHVQTITHIVRQLSKNIEMLESQIILRDHISSGSSFALQSLDQKNLMGIGDLRGRMARCDASIAKLSGAISATEREIYKLQQQITKLHSSQELQLRETEIKWLQSVEKLNAAMAEHKSSLKVTQGNLSRDMQLLEIKTSDSLKRLSDDSRQVKQWTEQQLRLFADMQTQSSGQQHSLLCNRMELIEKKFQECVGPLSVRVERAEGRTEQEHKAATPRNLEDKLDALEKSIWEELALIRKEYHSGFQLIYDAIESLSQISDAKAQLDRQKLENDIKHIRHKIVELRTT
ncbi:protein FAM81B isoform X2 [Brienomyrus brachyistius]|nr:protein FAM81B isoform X2 [Brienomyrus brachyistius]